MEANCGDALAPIDWAARWRAMVEARVAQSAVYERAGAAPGQDFWERRAARYEKQVARSMAADALLARLRQLIRPGEEVLDVGAGTGRYALPLARHGARVTAVEPSPAMRARLEEAGRAAGLSIAVVPARWEEAEVAPADVVLCAHVLYPVADAAPFLRKLDAHARRLALLALAVGQIDEPYAELWARLRGEPRRPQPAFLEAYNLLWQLGIAAEVELLPLEIWHSFDDRAEALAEVSDRLMVVPGSAEEERLAALLDEVLVPEGGRLVLPARPGRLALMRWGPTGGGGSPAVSQSRDTADNVGPAT